MYKNKLILSARLEDGDEIMVTISSVDKSFSDKDRNIFTKNVANKIKSRVDDIISYSVRYTMFGCKDNKSCKSFDEAYDFASTILHSNKEDYIG